MLNYFMYMLKYNEWATKEAAASILFSKVKIERAEKLLAHIIASQYVWINRIQGKENAGDPWEFFPAAGCLEMSSKIKEDWLNILKELTDETLKIKIEYKNTKGETFTNTIREILTHVINHWTYHRAQIAQLIRQSEGEPAKTDYIVYQRQFNK